VDSTPGCSRPSISEGKRSHPRFCTSHGTVRVLAIRRLRDEGLGAMRRVAGAPPPSSPAAFKSAPRTALTCARIALDPPFTTG
jgi:hypothetical protein